MNKFLQIAIILLCTYSSVSAHKISTAFALNKSLNLNDLKDRAGIVFRGSFEDFIIEDKNGLDARLLKFQVKEAFKGIEKGQKTIVLAEWAKVKSPFTEELIAKDMDYVFFFYEPSKKGFTSLVGMEQGMITVNNSKKLVFSNKLSNKKAKTRQLIFFTTEKDLETYQDLKNFLGS